MRSRTSTSHPRSSICPTISTTASWTRVILQPGKVLELDMLELVRCSRTGALLGTITTLDEYMAGSG